MVADGEVACVGVLEDPGAWSEVAGEEDTAVVGLEVSVVSQESRVGFKG